MPFNGNGTFVLPGPPLEPGEIVSADEHNELRDDMAAGFTDCVTRDGQSPAVANLPMGTYKHVNVGAANSLTNYSRVDQVQNDSFNWLTSVSGTDTITAASSIAPAAYAAGQRFAFIPAGSNTGAATININSLGAKSIKINGTNDLYAGFLNAGTVYTVVYDGTNFQVALANNAGVFYVERFSGDGLEDVFTLSHSAISENYLLVYIYGVYQQKDTYTFSGNTLTFSSPPPIGTDNIEVVISSTLALGETDASQVEYTLPATGAVTQTVETKLSETVSVKDFGAVGDGVTDDTAAFNAACALKTNVFVPPGTYKITNSVTVNGNLFGVQETSIINLEITSTTGKGFWMQSNSSISNLTINRAVNVTPSSGFFGCAIAIGAYSDTTGALVNNISVKNVTIVGSGTGGLSSTGKWNLICAIGNVSNFIFENISVSGKAYIPILCHWARKADGVSYISYHPRNGIIRNIECIYDVTTDNNWGGIYYSACHDIVTENVTVLNCARGFAIATGDVGGYYATDVSKGLVGANLNFKNIVIKNHTNEAFWIGSTTYPLTDPFGGTSRWFFTDNNASVSIDGLIIEQGADSTNQEVLLLQWAHNVNITNLIIGNVPGTSTSATAVGAYIVASVNVNIEGTIARQRACRVYSGANISFNGTQFVNPTNVADATSGDVGVTAYGSTPTTTTGSTVNIGDTSVVLTTVPCDIYPGLEFSDSSGNRYTFASSGKNGDTNQTLQIQPAIAAMASGTTITCENGAKGLNVNECAFNGYYRNVFTSGVGGVVPKNVGVTNSNFYSCGVSHIHLDDTRDAKITGNYFSKGGYLSSGPTGSADIRVNAEATGTVISNNVFNPSLDTLSLNNIYILGTASGVVITGNEFYKHNPDTTTYTTASSIYLNKNGKTAADGVVQEADYIVSNNFFGPAVINQVLPSTVRRSTTIGDSRIGNATTAPITGIWRQGDVVFNLGAVSAGYAGWICTSPSVTTTGTVNSGSTALTVASGTGIADGDRINIAGAGAAGALFQTTVSSGGGTTSITLGSAASTSVASASVQTPGTWKTFGVIS